MRRYELADEQYNGSSLQIYFQYEKVIEAADGRSIELFRMECSGGMYDSPSGRDLSQRYKRSITSLDDVRKWNVC